MSLELNTPKSPEGDFNPTPPFRGLGGVLALESLKQK